MGDITNSGHLKLNLDIDTDAFKAHPEAELADMLRYIADQIEDGMTSGYRVTDSNGEGLTSWTTDLPEAVEKEEEIDPEDIDVLDKNYVAFINKMYQSTGSDKDTLVDRYRINFDERLGHHELPAYIDSLAWEDTEMGPAHYLFCQEFRAHLADKGDLPENAEELFTTSR